MGYFMISKHRDAMKSVEMGEMMGDINVMMGTQPIEMDAQGSVKQRMGGIAAEGLIPQKTRAFIL